MPPTRPRLLRPDNFTPPTRTPWGGTRIVGVYKRELLPERIGQRVGESWEISVEPSFPSRLAGREGTLAELIAADPEGWLGAEIARRHGGQTPLLVKLLDAALNLSVQVHPADGDPALGPGESGKPESWIVLRAEPGAGLYLGFQEGVGRSEVERCVRASGPLDRLMNFVPVQTGDVFLIEAGTPHAIGAGVTLVEPQLVAPGRRGLTYRYWDWNRRYDASGERSPAGRPRPLHLDRALEVTCWDAPRGEAFVATCRGDRAAAPLHAPLARSVLVDWPWFRVEAWTGTGVLQRPAAGTMWALLCVEGWAEIAGIALPRGASCVIPAAAGAITMRGEGAQVLATRS